MNDKRQESLFPLALLLFFLSGFSALLCQVIWQRMLGLFSGVDVYSVTIIVSAFMLGMGIGNMAGGYIADHLPRKKLVAVFAISEFLIAASALSSKWLYYDVLYQGFPQLGASPVLLSVTLFFSLLIPTFFMGITLPVLSRVMVSHHGEASFRVGLLYALNTLGAAIGSLVSILFLVRHFGFENSLKIGAGLNLLAVTGATLIYFLIKDHAPEHEKRTDGIATGAAEKLHLPFGGWLLIYAYSGFIALALEIVWFRVLGVILKSTAFTFGILLGLYLAGLAIGAMLATLVSSRSKRPLSCFLLLQAGISIYAAISISFFVYFVDAFPDFPLIWNYLGEAANLYLPFKREDMTPIFGYMYFVVAPLLILPPTILMGASFPFLQAAVHRDVQMLGRRVGWLQTANIMGATGGAIIAGLVLLDVFGAPGTLACLVAMGGLYLLLLSIFSCSGKQRVAAIVLSLAVTVSVVAMIPSGRVFWAKLHGAANPDSIAYTEDNTGLSLIRSYGTDFNDAQYEGSLYLFINGAAQSNIPYGWPHSALGLFATIMHPDPAEVAIIGLGSGDTLFSSGSRPETRQITCIEILAAQEPNLKQVQQAKPYAGLEKLFQDERFEWIYGDARTWLMRSGRKFDVIEADTLRPNMAYAGNLYSKEYFELLLDSLKPGGYAVSWIPSTRTSNTFRIVFPYVVNIGHWMYIGSNEPIVIDREAMLMRVRDSHVREYFAGTGIDAESMVADELGKYVAPEVMGVPDSSNVNTDLFPKDEFEKP